MHNQILTILKRKLDDLGTYGWINAEISRNALKEELQFHVLNFIYHHPKYSAWIMYGGSALRIVHNLDRMSVDLDFEIAHAITEKFLEELKQEIESHFSNTYGTGTDFLTVKITTGRGLTLKFHVGEELRFGLPSSLVHIKIDLNHFVAPKAVLERHPINHDQLSFVIATYNLGSLMASKLAAIFLRGTRGVGEARYEEKGRDIYDLLWYMNKKVAPDFDYLMVKSIDIKDPRALFDKLTLQMNKVSDENLKRDLLPLFLNRTYIEHWLENWRESYLRLLDEYKITTVTTLVGVEIYQDFQTDNLSFTYLYNTEAKKSARIQYIMCEEWMDLAERDLPIAVDRTLDSKIQFLSGLSDGWSSGPASQNKAKLLANLFYQKTERYLEKTNQTLLGRSLVTKAIRMTANNFNPQEQILLNKQTLLSCDLDDLLQ